MKKGKFLILGMLAILLALGLVFVACDDGNKEITVEQAFNDLWRYFGNPETWSWEDKDPPSKNTGFYFYKSDDITGVAAVKTYWDSLPKTVYELRDKWYSDKNPDSNFYYEVQYHRGNDTMPGWLQIQIFYPKDKDNGSGTLGDSSKNYITERLVGVVPEKALEIAKNMVNRVK